MAITNLYVKYAYPENETDLPIVVLMHGFSNNAATFENQCINRIARLGLFVVVVGMRGRDSASGSQDGSGREIYDIVDAVEYVRTNFAALVSATKVAIVGYSGGGGNALAAACKFPDYWNVVVTHFGMSDYGYDGTDGWWYTNPANQATLTTWIGNRASVTNPYRARHAVEAIANFSGGELYLFHDDQDTSVPVVNTNRIGTAMDNASLTNYTKNLTTTTDDPRWLHEVPNDASPTRFTEAIWSSTVLSLAAWTIPASGTITVTGYIVTKRFTIWLNANGTATLGIDAAATVVYNTATDTYTVTPLTGALDVTITQGAKTGSATNISTATEIVVA